jgi:hypothetical protein
MALVAIELKDKEIFTLSGLFKEKHVCCCRTLSMRYCPYYEIHPFSTDYGRTLSKDLSF